MLVIFSSTVTGDVMMFGDIAKKLLRLMGQTGNIPGGITAEHIPAALQQLKQAVGAEPNPESSYDEGDAPAVGLAVRAFPLIEMLTTAEKEGASVAWIQK